MVARYRLLVVAAHALVLPLCYAAAFLLRFDAHLPAREAQRYWSTLPLLLGARLAAFAAFGLYGSAPLPSGGALRGRLLKAASAGSLLFGFALFLTRGLNDMPRTVLTLEWLVTTVVLVAAPSVSGVGPVRPPVRRVGGWRTLLVGNGEGLYALFWRLAAETAEGFDVVGLVDDGPPSPSAGSRAVGAVPRGSSTELADLVSRTRASLLLLTATATREQVRRAIACAGTFGVGLRFLGGADASSAAEPEEQPVVARLARLVAPGALAVEAPRHWAGLEGRTVLVLADGSDFAAELVRYIARVGPRRLVVLGGRPSGGGAAGLVPRELPLEGVHPACDVCTLPADAGDAPALRRALATFRPHLVVHAALLGGATTRPEGVARSARAAVATIFLAAEAARGGAERFVLFSPGGVAVPGGDPGILPFVEGLLLEWPYLRNFHTERRVVRVAAAVQGAAPREPRSSASAAEGSATRSAMRDVVRLAVEAAFVPEAAGMIAVPELAPSTPESAGASPRAPGSSGAWQAVPAWRGGASVAAAPAGTIGLEPPPPVAGDELTQAWLERLRAVVESCRDDAPNTAPAPRRTS